MTVVSPRTLRPTRRLERLAMPERAEPGGMLVGELEERLAAIRPKYTIEHDLTSAHTGAFPPPAYFAEGVARAVREGRPGYTPLRGDVAVRQALAPRLERMLGVPIDPVANMLLTAGTQAGLFSAMAALLQSGDTVLIADPEYLCHERVARFLGADVRYVPFVRLGEDAILDLDAVEQGFRDGARALIFSNPHNPTGSVMGPEALRQIAALAVQHDAWVIADELYARFVYDPAPLTHMASMPGMRERCVTALGPSKTESASGFRVGALIGPDALIRLAGNVMPIVHVRAPSYSQYALIDWLADDHDFIRGYVDRYRALRDITVERLAHVDGLTVATPAATAWLFPDISGLGRSELEVIEALMAEGILVYPGAYFGPAGGGCVRICFGQYEATWPDVVDRIGSVLDELRR
jgi:aspartate/methionine/tyrosine aminotransferase